MAEANVEPSMEAILSSIKRIIAEDADAMLSGPRSKRSVGLYPISAPAVADDSDEESEVLELTDPVAVEPKARQEPRVEAPKAVESAPAPTRSEKKPALVSPKTTEASRSSLAALSALIVQPEVAGSDTLEGLVREMLKPMLADWLDEQGQSERATFKIRQMRRVAAWGRFCFTRSTSAAAKGFP